MCTFLYLCLQGTEISESDITLQPQIFTFGKKADRFHFDAEVDDRRSRLHQNIPYLIVVRNRRAAKLKGHGVDKRALSGSIIKKEARYSVSLNLN